MYRAYRDSNGVVFTIARFSHREEELAALAAEIEELRRLDSTHSSSLRKLILVLDQRVKGSRGIVNRAIRTHINRLTLMELLNAKSGESKLHGLLHLIEAMQKVVEEDNDQSKAPKCSTSRLLLAVAFREAIVHGNTNSRCKLLMRFSALMRLMSTQVSNTCLLFQWVDPNDEWVVAQGEKHAISMEKVEGDTAAQRVTNRWSVMETAFLFAKAVAETGIIGAGRAGLLEQVGGLGQHSGVSEGRRGVFLSAA